MKQQYRILALILVGIILLATLTGCSQKKETDSGISQTAQPTVIPTAEPVADPASSIIDTAVTADFSTDGLTDTQRNSINMLNYLAVLTLEINSSQNSRLYLEEAYSSLVNNTYPNAVDGSTLSQLSNILDTLERYRLVAVKRERLTYVYEQNRAQALRSAIPYPLGLMSAVHSFNLSQLAASVVYMAVDSASSYASHSAQADMEYLQDGWVLDDEAATELHNSRKDTFSYMISIVSDYDLPGDLTLSEGAVNEFVRWKNNSNVVQRIQFLEANVATYQALGTYWLVLADSYYENGEYANCMSALRSYESLATRIFRKDYEYARLLPLAIISAGEVLSGDEYINTVEHYAVQILNNTDYSDWVSRYFVAQTYIQMYSQTNNLAYLEKAYDLALNNVNNLVNEQKALNKAYLAPIATVEPPKDATKEEKADIKKYNELLASERKTALPPIYEPLVLNCELLFSLANELEISSQEQQRIESLLHENGSRIFLSIPLDLETWFAPDTIDTAAIDIQFNGKEVIIPAQYVSASTSIRVLVTDATTEETVLVDDWIVNKVERKNAEDLASFAVTYKSSAAEKFKYTAGATIIIEVVSNSTDNVLSFEYSAVQNKVLLVFDSIGFQRAE